VVQPGGYIGSARGRSNLFVTENLKNHFLKELPIFCNFKITYSKWQILIIDADKALTYDAIVIGFWNQWRLGLRKKTV